MNFTEVDIQFIISNHTANRAVIAVTAYNKNN